MIDVVREISMFKPIDLARIPEKYRPATEQMRTSFILYNKALHEVQIGHDDAAKNYLRKAVTIFPGFYDAVMVLGILVFANGDRIGAVRIFNSVKDLEQRAISIGILDHLVEEAERPETSRILGTKKYTSEHGKAESVMGGRTTSAPRTETKEAKYSRGQIFEKSSSYYEPQSKSTYNTRQAATYRTTANSERRMPQPRKEEMPEEASYSSDSKDVRDVRLLNKYLLVIIVILLIFAIVVSTMLINRTASERARRDKVEALSASQTPSSTMNPEGTPSAGVTGTSAE